MPQPVQTVLHKYTGEQITFIENTNDHLLIEVSLPPGGEGPPIHCHDQFTEEFTVMEGELTITHNEQTLTLVTGQSIFVPLQDSHTFNNKSAEPVRFNVKLSPGKGFEQSVRIHYGLMDDGLTNNKGTPKSIFHTIYILDLQNTLIAGKSFTVQRLLFKTIIGIGNLLGSYKGLEKYYMLPAKKE